MAEPTRRIVVDGVDFAALFQFPRIFRSITGAMQPPRLVIALLMVAAVIAFGRAWDGASTPTVSPAGLTGGRLTAEQATELQNLLRTSLVEQGLGVPEPAANLDARDAMRQLDRRYRERRAAAPTPAEAEAIDADFLAVRTQIESLAPSGPFASTLALLEDNLHRVVRGVILLQPTKLVEAVRNIVQGSHELWRQYPWFCICFNVFVLVIMSIGGGALCRMAACQMAGHERLNISEAFDFALSRWPRLLLAPIAPLFLAAIAAAMIVVLGLPLLAPWLDVLGGLLYGATLLAGFVLAFVLVAYVLGLPLLLPAVATENCDAADAQARVGAYVLNRPLHLLGYGVTAVIGLSLGYVVVSVVAVTMLNGTASVLGSLFGNPAIGAAGGFHLFDLSPEPAEIVLDSRHHRLTAGMIAFWQHLVIDLVAAWVVGYFFDAATTVYLLMRRACDGQDVDEIWRPGLTPGTLVPVAPPVGDRAWSPESAGAAGRVIDGAVRAATAVRYGDGEASEPAEGPPESS